MIHNRCVRKHRWNVSNKFFSCILNHNSPNTSAQVFVCVGMYIPYCRYIKNKASRIQNMQKDSRDCFGKCIVLGDQVTFLFTGCRSLSGPSRKSSSFFSSQEWLPSTQKRFAFWLGCYEFYLSLFQPEICLCCPSHTKNYSLSLAVTVKLFSLSL